MNQPNTISSNNTKTFSQRLFDFLKNITSPDQKIRLACETGINELQNNDFASFLKSLFVAVEIQDLSLIAAIVLKNSLHSNDPTLQKNIESRWKSLIPEFKSEIKRCLLEKLAIQVPKIRSLIASTLAGIARIEILDTWKSFFVDMNQIFSQYNQLRCGIIDCIGNTTAFLHNETQFDFISDEEIIFQILISGLQDKTSKKESLKAFSSCVKIFDTSINTIQSLNMLLSALTSYEEDDETICLECLNHLVAATYEKLKLNNVLEKIVIFMNSKFNSPNEKVILAVIDFWNCLFKLENNEKNDFNSTTNLTEKYLVELTHHLLNHLYKSEEQDGSEWNAHKAASSALKTLSQISKEDLLSYEFIQNFILKNIDAPLLLSKRECFGFKENSPNKEIGFIALGSVVNKKSFVKRNSANLQTGNNLKNNSLEFLEKKCRTAIDHFDSEIGQSAIWCIAEVCFFDCRIIENEGYFEKMIEIVCEFIQRVDESSLNATWLLNNVCECISKDVENCKKYEIQKFGGEKNNSGQIRGFENLLSPFYIKIMNVVVLTIERVDISNMNLRLALFSALNELVKCTSTFSMAELDRLLDFILVKIDECLNVAHTLPSDKFLIFEDIMSNYIILLQTIVSVRTESQLRDKREQILQTFIKILSLKRNSTIFADVYIALSHLCSKTSYFTIKIDRIIPYMHRDFLCATSQTEFGLTDNLTMKALVNFVGDLANLLCLGFLKYSSQLVNDLIMCLTTDLVTREIKSEILCILGDIAMALGPSYGTYLNITLDMIKQILLLDRNQNIVYIDNLRLNSLQLLTCIIIGMNNDPLLSNKIEFIIPMIIKIHDEDERDYCLLETLRLVSDILDLFGNVFNPRWLAKVVARGKINNDKEIKDAAEKVSCYQ
ncbi:Importin subunit beta-1 [Dictyocoela muelleri]|nr:Importin subunit beta-1 [Dictyocoela muelleri]